MILIYVSTITGVIACVCKLNDFCYAAITYCSISDHVVDIIHLPSVVFISNRPCFRSKKLSRVFVVMIN